MRIDYREVDPAAIASMARPGRAVHTSTLQSPLRSYNNETPSKNDNTTRAPRSCAVGAE